ncbi:hypothetical protein GGI11_008154, partial [Coemansia sp. RSA 2049]
MPTSQRARNVISKEEAYCVVRSSGRILCTKLSRAVAMSGRYAGSRVRALRADASMLLKADLAPTMSSRIGSARRIIARSAGELCTLCVKNEYSSHSSCSSSVSISRACAAAWKRSCTPGSRMAGGISARHFAISTRLLVAKSRTRRRSLRRSKSAKRDRNTARARCGMNTADTPVANRMAMALTTTCFHPSDVASRSLFTEYDVNSTDVSDITITGPTAAHRRTKKPAYIATIKYTPKHTHDRNGSFPWLPAFHVTIAHPPDRLAASRRLVPARTVEPIVTPKTALMH